MNIRNTLALAATLVFVVGCGLANHPKKDEIITTPSKKLICIDTVLKSNQQFGELTLREEKLAEHFLHGDIYLYSFKFKNTRGFVFVRYQLFSAKPEVELRLIHHDGDSVKNNLQEVLWKTIKKLKESCDGYNVHGSVEKYQRWERAE